jgi:hypothetical protein
MEVFLLSILCVAVLCLIILQWTRGQRIDDLQNRLDQLERTARQSERIGPQPERNPTQSPPAPTPLSFTPPPIIPFRNLTPFQPPPALPTPPHHPSLEERLGQNWLNKLGIVILVIGIALFLGYQLRTLGPLGKSLIGLALSITILGGGLLLERHTRYRIFARAAIAGGWALTFFVTFALYHVAPMQVLHSQSLDLILMFAAASAMVWHSLFYESQTVTTLAFLLAFITVGISEITLFSLVAGVILASALVYIAAREAWFALALAGLIGIYLNHFLWLHHLIPNGASPNQPFHDFIASASLLLVYWLLFRLLYIFRIPATREQATLSTLTAILNSIGLLSLLKFQSSHPEWAFFGLLALGTAEFILAFIARRARPTHTAAFTVLSTIASILLIAAIPFRFTGNHWSLLWLLQSECLFLAGVRTRERLFRRLGLLAVFAACAKIVISALDGILTHSSAPTSTNHPLAITLFTATLLFWFNAELTPLLWPSHFDSKTQATFDTAQVRITSFLAPLCALFALQILFPKEWGTISWTALAILCLTLGWLLNRASFTAQSLAVLIAAAIRFAIALIDLPTFAVRAAPVAVRVGPPAVMFLALPIAFAIRRQRVDESNHPPFLLARPEQAFFFVPLFLLTLLLAADLRAGMITIAWGALGVLVFAFALTVKERSFRLAGLFLLLLAAAKILLIDVWHATPTDRYLTLIVIGAALLLVSFLYSRYRETLLNFL